MEPIFFGIKPIKLNLEINLPLMPLPDFYWDWNEWLHLWAEDLEKKNSKPPLDNP